MAETVKDFVDYASYPSVKINTTQHSLFPLTALFKDPHINVCWHFRPSFNYFLTDQLLTIYILMIVNFQFVYVGNMTVRGMAADQWKANFYSRYDSKTYDITVTFSGKINFLFFS